MPSTPPTIPGADAVFTRSKKLSYSRLAGEVLIIDPVKRYTHRLTETAAFLWERCDGRLTARQLSQTLADAFDVAPAEAERDTLETLAKWEALGLAVRCT